MVMDALTESVRDGSLLKINYADNLVLCCESVEKVMGKYEEWKEALEGKGLRKNIRKTYIKTYMNREIERERGGERDH